MAISWCPWGRFACWEPRRCITDQPDDYRIEAWEVSKILSEADVVVPGIRQGRALRAWAGVRPLYEPPEANNGNAAGRDVKRTFSVIDHAERDGVRGLVTVVGGKLTTCRLMAEKAVDVVCQQLGVTKPCTTTLTMCSPASPQASSPTDHRLHSLEHGEMPGELICECEWSRARSLKQAIDAYGDQPVALDDLRRDLRLGMGPCQGGFCSYRAAGILRESKIRPATKRLTRWRILSRALQGSTPAAVGPPSAPVLPGRNDLPPHDGAGSTDRRLRAAGASPMQS